MAGWLNRVINAKLASYWDYLPSQLKQPTSSGAVLCEADRIKIPLDDEALRKIIRYLIGESKRTVQDILQLSMTCKSIRALCNEPDLWRELCVLHYKAPPRPVNAVPWRELYKYNCEMFRCAFTREGSQTYGSSAFAREGVVHLRA